MEEIIKQVLRAGGEVQASRDRLTMTIPLKNSRERLFLLGVLIGEYNPSEHTYFRFKTEEMDFDDHSIKIFTKV